MKFAFEEEQDDLRATVAKLVRERSDLLDVVGAAPAKSSNAYPENLWRGLVALGLPALCIPEEFGGVGGTFLDQVIAMEEVGRTLAPCRLLGNHFGVVALLVAGDDGVKADLFPGVGVDSVRLALAWTDGVGDATSPSGNVRLSGGRLVGTHDFVIDADSATHLVVAAARDTGEEVLSVVEAAQDGVCRELLDWHDLTRRVARVGFDGAPAREIGGGLDFATVWSRIRDLALVGVNGESIGGAVGVLEIAATYAKRRRQFGRPIASFQAVKHKGADMFARGEAARNLAYFHAWTMDDGTPGQQEVAAAMAKSYCSDTFWFSATEAIQMHGAVGLTWELPLHLYLKRARANAALFGAPPVHRDRLPDLVAKHGHALTA